MFPAFCWAFLIAALYAIPGSELRSLSFWEVFGADKIAHMVVFALFGLILRVGMRRQTRFPGMTHRSYWLSFLIVVAYGGILELFQGVLFVERTSDLLDFIANTIGAVLGLLLFRLIYGRELSR